MKPTIYLAFVDDWELSGNGSGDIRELQFRPMRHLVNVYNANGIRGSFNAETMQQLSFRKHQEAHPELKELADEWDHNVRETFRQGHDIQLHVHPQWLDATYKSGEWHLSADWSILNHEPDVAYGMLQAGKQYLENLLKPLDPDYRCISFRAGSWCIAPSPHILNLLVKLGIVFDMSIVGGLHYQTKNITLDYTSCEEDFLPYYPVMTDARKVSPRIEPLICVPTFHFFSSRRQVFKHQAAKAWAKAKQRFVTTDAKDVRSVEVYGQEWAEKSHSSITTRIYDKGLKPYLKGKHLLADIAQLDYALLQEMLSSIRARARAQNILQLPVILENHTKDVRDFSHIERFVADVAKAEDIKCVTLTELERELKRGTFSIRSAAAH
ncbi:MAG TPA: hypothetical protein VJS64_19310 [Pyrinomonadaceae bacterium]|nr:hypothetical protein [Pyrinomonadaceae bacterium]